MNRRQLLKSSIVVPLFGVRDIVPQITPSSNHIHHLISQYCYPKVYELLRNWCSRKNIEWVGPIEKLQNDKLREYKPKWTLVKEYYTNLEGKYDTIQIANHLAFKLIENIEYYRRKYKEPYPLRIGRLYVHHDIDYVSDNYIYASIDEYHI